MPEALWASIQADREALGAGSDGEDGMDAPGDGGDADDPLASLEHQPFRLKVEWMRHRLEALLVDEEAAADARSSTACGVQRTGVTRERGASLLRG